MADRLPDGRHERGRVSEAKPMSAGRIKDPDAFIRAQTRVKPVPHTPEISLHLADEAMELWQKTEDELGELGLPLPFWAFAWAGGQGLARYILDHPETVRGKAVLDFACGSGLVGIAAMKAGASSCHSVDIDPFAIAASRLNSATNGVHLNLKQVDLTAGGTVGADIAFFGDVFYDRPMADKVLELMDRLLAAGRCIYVGDPGRSYLPKHRLKSIADYQVPVVGSLEDADIKRTGIYRLVV